MKIEKYVDKLNLIKLFMYVFIYKTVIELIYIYRISPLYDYTGLTLDISVIAYFVSLLYLILLIMLLPKDKTRPSTYLYLIFIIFLVVPLLSFYWLNNKSIYYISFVILACLVISFFLRLVKPIYFFEEIKSAKFLLSILFILYILITIYLIVKRGGIDLRAFDFGSIYDLRSEVQFSGISGYLLNWCAKVFCPFFFAYFLFKNEKGKMLIALILQLLLYLSFGFKAYLFSIGMLVMVAIAVKRNRFERDFTWGFICIIVASYALDILNITSSLRNSIPFRMVYVPAQIQYQYYDFFENRDKMFFADGIIGKILSVESPFNQPVPFIISSYFHNGAVSNSNTGIFSDAYANGGFFNMIFFALLLAMIFYLIDSLTRRIPKYIVVAAFSYMMFVLNDNSLLTAFLTGGIGLMLILLLLFNSSLNENYETKWRRNT
ncbi:oligosaccharide repeat unit polymerase [Bacillus sp. RO2]|uniref:oligosaccharide repeat unit polymerase n=1 Tax=Bacillus sp. RO2 TaxID=2723913 RepID=UPI00145F3C01|nr:oligosaccharide repeat unit polymerase [Bacillus sp. RO2]NMH73906.1 oligosaccharide repeat unit polymerase [Bacillus sp. RO2]